MKDVEYIENADLLENNLKHIQYELSLDSPSYFRIAVESHNALLRAMVQALQGSSNSFINKKLDKEKKFTFCLTENSPVMIKKEKVNNCINAWKFSSPVSISSSEIDESNILRTNDDYKKHLIGFYDLLAMIQCDYFMKLNSNANTINISDEDLAFLDWLHQEIRNEYEHFIPKTYGATINNLLYTSILCIDICNNLLVGTSNIYLMHLGDKFKNQLEIIKNRLTSGFK